MNSEEMIDHIAARNNVSRAEAKRTMDSVLDAIRDGLSVAGKARLGDIGTFSIRHVEARQGRNPQTGEPMTIEAGNRLYFRANAAFKRKIQ